MPTETTGRRLLRRFTAGTTTLGLLALAVPAVTGPAREGYGGAAPPATPGPPAAHVADGADLELVSHRKPHPRRVMKRHRVRPGDTPSSVAVRHHAWTDELIRVNHSATLYVGEVILVPVVRAAVRACREHRHHRTNMSERRHGAAADRHGPRRPGEAGRGGDGRDGDGRDGDGREHARGGADHKGSDKKGSDKPKVDRPTKKPKASKAERRQARAARIERRRHHHAKHARGWHHEHASRAKVRRVVAGKARDRGVDPHLALAISWQESGWQHRRVSSAGALGAMQVMPGTGRWMSAVVGRRLNIRDLHDNVIAGVVLIRELRDQARLRHAVAGYYQGLYGVRTQGMYPSTRRYVADVLALKKRLRGGWDPS